MKLKIGGAALAVLALVGSAFAAEKGNEQPVVTGQNTGGSMSVHDGTQWWTVTGTSAGINMANAPQNLIYRYPTVLQNRRSPGELPDSSAVYPASGATKWFLSFYPTVDDSAGAVVFAIQVRAHSVQSSDSLTTFVWMPTCSGSEGGSTTYGVADSLGTLRNMNVGLTDVDDVLPNERALVIVHHASPRGMWLPITTSKCNRDFAADWISVRVRALRVYSNLGTVYATPVQTSYKADLYGYR
jgi:hypothetical protein